MKKIKSLVVGSLLFGFGVAAVIVGATLGPNSKLPRPFDQFYPVVLLPFSLICFLLGLFVLLDIEG